MPFMRCVTCVVFLLLVILFTNESKILNPCKAGGYQGDVALSDDDLRVLRSRRAKRAVTSEKERKWRHGIIPYEISNDFNGKEKAVIQAAIRHWETNTCISFVERESEEEYAVFQNDGDCGCCSYVGRMGEGQAQGVNLGENCVQNGTVIHEIGHLIGFWHEHTRPDRDSFVEIMSRNVLSRELKNFRMLKNTEVNSFNVGYDFGSIMHYAKYTFSKNGFEITIRPRPGLYSKEIGQRVRLSPLDIKQANLLYNCPTCGKTLTDSKGVFSFSTSELEQLRPMTCTWRISWTAGEKLSLKIMHAHFHFKCKKAYLEIRDGSNKKSPLIGRYCKENKPPRNIFPTSKSLWVTFRYGYRYYYDGKPIGFKAEYEISCGGHIKEPKGVINSPNYPENYKANQNCDWKIIVARDAKVAVKFTMLDLKDKTCESDYVELIDDGTNQQLKKLCGSKLFKDYIISSSNKMVVRFRSGDIAHGGGFSLKFLSEVDECKTGRHNCSYGCKNTVGGYGCFCKDGDQLHSNGRDCEKACGKVYNLDDRGGVITSPSYPSNYPINRDCTWRIHTKKGYKIILEITDFDLEDVCNPNYDYLEIVAGEVGEKLCGKIDTPKRFESQSNKMIVNFHTDDTVSGRGFKAKIRHIEDFCARNNGGCNQNCTNTDRSSKCSCKYGYTLKADMKTCIAGECKKEIKSPTGRGSVTSPDYPKMYRSDRACKWRVSTVPGQRFNITLQDVVCDEDGILKVWWEIGKRNRTEHLCPGKAKKQISFLTDGNNFNIEFNKGSFRLKYTSECGGTLVAVRKARKFFSHLNFGSKDYPENQNCKWLIYARGRKKKVSLRFTQFKLEEKPCNFDYVKVYDGDKATEDNLLNTECGRVSQRQYKSTGSYLTVVFRSDTSVADRGFEAQFKKKIPGRSKRHHIRLFDPFNDAATSSRTRDFYF